MKLKHLVETAEYRVVNSSRDWKEYHFEVDGMAYYLNIMCRDKSRRVFEIAIRDEDVDIDFNNVTKLYDLFHTITRISKEFLENNPHVTSLFFTAYPDDMQLWDKFAAVMSSGMNMSLKTTNTEDGKTYILSRQDADQLTSGD